MTRPAQSATDERPLVVIVGGGVTGAAVALHLIDRFAPGALRIAIIEPRQRLGAGLAYDTAEPVHRTNVPPLRMSVHPEDPERFLRWLEETDALRGDPDVFDASGAPYPQRGLFGRFMDGLMRPHVEAGAIEHLRTRAIRATPDAGGWSVETQDGRRLQAWTVVLTTSHPPPALPAGLTALSGHAGLVADTTRPGALDGVLAQSRVLIVGNGLTAADAVAALKHRGHRGPIVSLSRRGLRAQGHSPREQAFEVDFSSEPSTRASHLLARIRRALAAAKAGGFTWHPVVDALRTQNGDIWRALPVAERRRIARHARPFWDVHRFRIAPQVEAAVNGAIADGSLTVLAASVTAAEPAGRSLRVAIRRRGEAALVWHDFDHVIVTTGPAHGGILSTQPLLSSLADTGALTPCPTGLGIACDVNARALDRSGSAWDDFLIAGPLARGTFGEVVGITQVATHAAFVAERVRLRWENERATLPLRRAGAPG